MNVVLRPRVEPQELAQRRQPRRARQPRAEALNVERPEPHLERRFDIPHAPAGDGIDAEPGVEPFRPAAVGQHRLVGLLEPKPAAPKLFHRDGHPIEVCEHLLQGLCRPRLTGVMGRV